MPRSNEASDNETSRRRIMRNALKGGYGSVIVLNPVLPPIEHFLEDDSEPALELDNETAQAFARVLSGRPEERGPSFQASPDLANKIQGE